MSKLTQRQLVAVYMEKFGVMTPAKLGGRVYRGTMFGSEISRTCRSLRAEGLMRSSLDGQFAVFILTPNGKKWVKKMLKSIK